MELSLCQGRISFHIDWLLNNTGADFSLLASLPQLVSHCHSLVSRLYQQGVGVGGDRKTEIKEDKEWSLWDNMRELLINVGRGIEPTAQTEFFNKRRTWVWLSNEAPTRYQRPRGLGWAQKTLTGHPFILQ